MAALTSLYPQHLKQLRVLQTLSSTMKEPRKPAAFPIPSCPGAPSTASPIPHSTYLAPRLPLMMGAVTTLLPFMGWLMTDSGTVIRVGSFPYREKESGLSEGGGKDHHPASPRGRRSRGVLCGAQCSYGWGPDEGSHALPRGHLSVSLLLPAESEQQSAPAGIRIKRAPEPQGKACVPFNTGQSGIPEGRLSLIHAP